MVLQRFITLLFSSYFVYQGEVKTFPYWDVFVPDRKLRHWVGLLSVSPGETGSVMEALGSALFLIGIH